MSYYYRPAPEPVPPSGHTFDVWLGDGKTISIWISRRAVNISYGDIKVSEKILWTAFYLLSENPALATLYHPRFGWDFVRLVGLIRSDVSEMISLNLRDPEVRKAAGLDTVSIPSRDRSKQEKRPTEQAMEMICDYVRDNPNCTRLDIAKALGRAKNPYVLAQIERLVQAGTLARTHIIRPNGAVEFRYIFVGDND